MTKGKQLIIALGVGALALFGNKTYLDTRVSELSPKSYQSVVRAKTRLRAGTRLTTALVERANVPKAYLPKAAIQWSERDALVGEELSVDVLKGDYILNNYFSVGGSAGKTLSQHLAGENVRAVTLPVDDTNSLADSVVAGDRIDILFTFTMPIVNQKVSTLILQNVLVLSTGGYSQAEQELGARAGRRRKYNSLTLKLSPEDAMKLNYARQIGKINVMLRSPEDDGLVQSGPVGTIADLLSPSDKEAIAQLAQRLQGARGSDDQRLKKQLATLLELQRRQNISKDAK